MNPQTPTLQQLAPDPTMGRGRLISALPAAALVAAILGSVLYSGKGILTKAGMAHGADALQMLGLRMAFAAPVFAALWAWSLMRTPMIADRTRDLLQAAGLGLLGCWISPVLNFYGLRTVSASLERILIYACPVLIVLFAFLLGRERMTRKGLAALVLSYTGVFVAVLGRDGGALHADPVGTAAILVGCVSYALFVVFSVPLQKRLGVTLFTSTAMLTASVACGVQLWLQLGSAAFLHPPTAAIPLALIMAWGCTVLPGFLVGYSVQHLGAGRSSVLQMLGPLVTPLAAAYFLGERMSPPQVAGFALLLLGGLWGAKR